MIGGARRHRWAGVGPGCGPVHVQGACLCVDMSPNQAWVVAGCHDGAVHIWQLVTVQEQGVQLTELTCGG